MGKFNDAAITIRKAAVKYEQMVALAAVLDDIGSLEQVASEAQKAAEVARAEAAKAKDEETKVKAKLKDALAKVDAAEASAVATGTAIVRTAEERAAEIERTAQEKAAATITAAQIEASAITSGQEMQIAKGREDLAAMKKDLAALTAACEANQAGLAKFEKTYADSRKKLAALIGD